MIDLLQITQPVAREFELFKEDFSKALRSEIPLLQSAIEQVLRANGKHIRPLLLLLTAKACGIPTQTSCDMAVIIEMLHTTTLIHDDVVDETKQRRGVPSLNAVFDNRVAVLTGDYMLAGTLLKVAETGNMTIMKSIAQVCRDLSEGELIEIDNMTRHSLNENEYLQMISQKTAALMSTCAEIGAISVGAPSETVLKCRTFGENLGVCFQIKDDIFDYFDDVAIGKPTGNDVREGKITLPLIHTLNKCGKDSEALLQIINNEDFSPENIQMLIAFARENGGVEYAERRLGEYKRKAVEAINSLPASDARQSLLALADYLSERTN